MKSLGILLILFFGLTMSGCSTAIPPMAEDETPEDVKSALGTVAGAIAGQGQLSDEELAELEQQLREDPEAQSAVQTITSSMSGTAARVKYCPQTGKRYAPRLDTCPIHNIPLESLEN